MIDLREYADIIKAAVAIEDDRDLNWKWGARNIGKSVVHIRWVYLDYLGEKCDFIIISSTEDLLGDCLTARDTSGEMITFAVVDERFGDVKTAEQGIERMVHAIANYAQSRY
ncbi:hypothetical protein FACS1894187_04350 [Synergistales bacterium]|nr:hypothetical protein FACS1894187_04350 [Synergistales bacterium]